MGFRVPSAAELTREQLDVFDLPAAGKYLVSGPPGTGKTILALLRAQKLVKLGHRPTIVMYNKALGAMVRAEAEELGLGERVMTYHQWFSQLHKKATGKGSVPQVRQYEYDWNQVGTYAGEYYAKRKSLDLDYVLVDEAQDLPADFLGFLSSLGSNVTVFADENQRITDTQSTISQLRSAILPARELEVRTNFRNTAPVARLARHFYTGLSTGIPDLPSRPGTTPSLVRVSSNEDLAAAVANVALSEPFRESYGVLVKRMDVRDAVAKALPAKLKEVAEARAAKDPAKAARIKKRAADLATRVYAYVSGSKPVPPMNEPGIFAVCHASAKGLQFGTAVASLAGLKGGDQTTAKMSLYVLTSRPEHEMYLAWVGSDAGKAAEAVPDFITEIPQEELRRVAMKNG